MSDAQRDYWTECVEISFEEAGISATPEQIEIVAGGVEGCHENYGMAFYTPPAGEYLRSEVADLKRQLQAEIDKVLCAECNGRGSITIQGPIHSSTSSCRKCKGDGRHAPGL